MTVETNPPCLYCGLPLADTGHGRKYHPPCARKNRRDKARLAARQASLTGECRECHQAAELIYHDDGPIDWEPPYNDITSGKYCSLGCFAAAARRRLLWEGTKIQPIESLSNARSRGNLVSIVASALEAGRLPDKLDSLPKEKPGGDVLSLKGRDKQAVRTGSASKALNMDESALLDWLVSGRPKHPHNNAPSEQKTVTSKSLHPAVI